MVHYASMSKLIVVFLLFFSVCSVVSAQDIHEDLQGTWKARVVEVVSQHEEIIGGTGTPAVVQEIQAEILEGPQRGEVVTFINDYIPLREGQRFYLNYFLTINGDKFYSVQEVDRGAPLLFFVLLFVFVIIIFGGKQGVRSLISLAGSFFVILYIMAPAILQGHSPVTVSAGIATIILFAAIFFTHGFNRESAVALVGTVSAVFLTSLLAYLAVKWASFTGFASDEAVYLNFDTQGAIDFAGLLLGGIIIGVLGVLDDIAVTQTVVVTELYNAAPHLTWREVYTKALRVGREHVGALVNTLALAYAGASLPLILLFSRSTAPFSLIINQEIFASEIIRIIVGSIGLVLTVPITTLLAVWLLKNYKGKGGGHHHGHVHVH
jgi:uncharacterized membrane protein